MSTSGVVDEPPESYTMEPVHEQTATLHTYCKESALLHRSLAELPHMVTNAQGSFLFLGNGQKILDACGGAAVAILGHGNPEVIAATVEQMQKVSYVHTMSYTTKPAEELAQFLVNMGGDAHKLTKAYLVGSGSEANEAALKAARQYFVERGEVQRCYYVARRQSYHGNTMGAMTVSSNLARKAPYTDVLPSNVSFVSPAYAYRYQEADETEEQYAARLISELRQEFLRITPEKIISFIAEPVVGATSGCVPAPRGYFRGVRDLCEEYGILLHLDEVMCGVGRTGTYFAFEQEGIQPDIVTIGKGLGGGYVPISAMLLGDKVVDSLRRGTSAFNHGQTFQAHPVACAAALAVQKIVKRDHLLQRCAECGQKLGRMLWETFADCRYVGDIRGRGLFWAMEFVQDPSTRAPFPKHIAFGARIHKAAFDFGVAIYPGTGTVDGVNGDHVLIAPPFTVSDEELCLLVSTLKRAYDVAEDSLDG
ncbi:adenosylmethionine-8-amino-7-oxononanoate aminotransferase, putative [Talaromyces stipitatus ATCC 10500]|uniref:Adenosylmethionine-8-amino-7-oxononanoate aminotransferase, putative n=1 Tax=Talaromyces stipitatus (strain ATCC 10500 / CBS 375.48 / QM 6759 / NRRL 1006) TaxID=441959 RepID=B8MCG1_TALSN|nr:adenosylmethionine-8-amino-7-oxononanoate aminotransferase, putative [Talaromyces stipitatus ATCC 10500]EED18777.1 adenosylmethionine-8-amino-7-oxononanoate aminotransferase, putative [Talaromyces stipitatus ATCC 10500]